MLDDYRLDIEEIDQERIVVTVPALRLIVIGQTLDEVWVRVRAALAMRAQEAEPRPERSAADTLAAARAPG